MRLKNTLAILLAVLMIGTLAILPNVLAATYNGSTVYYTVINDTMLDLMYASMPALVGEKMYVPYTLFTEFFGIRSSYSAAEQILFLSNAERLVRFDITRGMAYDKNLNEIRQAALIIRGQVFVPAEFVADYFGFYYSFVSGADIVRLSDNSATYPDQMLSSVYADKMHAMLTALTAAVTSTTTVTSTSTQTSTTVVKKTTLPPAVSQTTLPPRDVYLYFLLEDDKDLPEILETLNARGLYACFFCSADAAASLPSLLVRGQSVGVLISRPPAGMPVSRYHAYALAQAADINDRFFRLSRVQSRALLMDFPDGPADALTAAGYDVLTPGFLADPDTDVLASVLEYFSSTHGSVYLALRADADTASILAVLLDSLCAVGGQIK